MNLKAIIMAGGEGARLRPMTMNRPKPMVPLLGRPVMAYTLTLLKNHGVRDVGVTLCYQPKAIRAAFGSGEKNGMHITYFEETCPLGTAGSVAMAREQLKETFFVLSGDGLTDCDLTAAMKCHKEKNALATIVLKRVKVPLPYGVVMTEKNGRIVRFVEKPDWSGVYSNLVNTGIYILEPEVLDEIDKDNCPDFGKDIFPALLRKKAGLYGYEMQGYWCDVGSQEAYLQAQMDLLAGKVQLDFPNGIHARATVQERARLQGHFYIGQDAVVEKGAVIRNSVIGPGCRVEEGAVVDGCCLWERAAMGKKARAKDSVLCDGATVRAAAELSEGCAIGQGSVVGAHARVRPGMKVWPGMAVPSGAVVTENVTAASHGNITWLESGAACRSAMEACRLTTVYGETLPLKKVIVGYLDAPAYAAVACGALADMGVQVLQAGWMTEAMLQENVAETDADGGLLATRNEIVFVNAWGEMLPEGMRRKMAQAWLCGAITERQAEGSICPYEKGKETYLNKTVPERGEKTIPSFTLCCENAQVLKLAMDGMRRMGAGKVRALGERKAVEKIKDGEPVFYLSEDGKEMICSLMGAEIEKTQLDLLCLKMTQESAGAIYDLPDVPRAAAALGKWQCADDSHACRMQRRRMQDGLFRLWTVCAAMAQKPLAAWAMEMPKAHIVCRQVECTEGDKGRILYALCEKAALPYTLSRGMQVRHEKGYATIVPDQCQARVHIVSEAANIETANELCDFYDREIRKALQENADY